MTEAMLVRGTAIARAAQARAIAQGAARIAAMLPDVAVATTDDAIVLSAPRLGARSIDDARLRWLGSLFR